MDQKQIEERAELLRRVNARPTPPEHYELEELKHRYEQAVELLRNSKLQIEYLQEKFRDTGTGNQLLSQIKSFLQKQ